MRRVTARALAALVAAVLAGCATSTPSPATSGSVSESPAPATQPPTATTRSSPTPTTASTATLVPRSTDHASAAATSPPTIAPTARATATPALPTFDHVYVLVLENHEYGSIVGSSQAPYLNGLIARYGLATDYHGVAHPSEPNYLALWAGSTFGVRDDGVHDLSATSVADQLDSHGRSWHVYAQNLPSACSTVATSDDGGRVDLVGKPGWYARKHEPAISFTSVSGSPARCARITRLATFSPTAADLELIVPNEQNDMHDGTIADGDGFLAAFVPRITDSPAFARSLLLITFDEGATSAGGGGHVATVAISPLVRPGARSDVAHDHYSLLRTIENAWNLGCVANTCAANDLRELFAG